MNDNDDNQLPYHICTFIMKSPFRRLVVPHPNLVKHALEILHFAEVQVRIQ